MGDDLFHSLRELLRAMDASEVRYAVVGGLALAGLIRVKVLAGRPQALANIAHLEDLDR